MLMKNSLAGSLVSRGITVFYKITYQKITLSTKLYFCYTNNICFFFLNSLSVSIWTVVSNHAKIIERVTGKPRRIVNTYAYWTVHHLDS